MLLRDAQGSSHCSLRVGWCREYDEDYELSPEERARKKDPFSGMRRGGGGFPFGAFLPQCRSPPCSAAAAPAPWPPQPQRLGTSSHAPERVSVVTAMHLPPHPLCAGISVCCW